MFSFSFIVLICTFICTTAFHTGKAGIYMPSEVVLLVNIKMCWQFYWVFYCRQCNDEHHATATSVQTQLRVLSYSKSYDSKNFFFSFLSYSPSPPPLASPTFAQVMVTATRLVQRKCTSSGTGKGTTMYGLLFGARGFILNPHIPFLATIRKKNADITPVTRFLTHSLLGGSKGLEGQTRLCVASLSRRFPITM